MSEQKINAYLTKYALTEGIIKISGVLSDKDGGRVVLDAAKEFDDMTRG